MRWVEVGSVVVVCLQVVAMLALFENSDTNSALFVHGDEGSTLLVQVFRYGRLINTVFPDVV